jgi:hypothetical protein
VVGVEAAVTWVREGEEVCAFVAVGEACVAFSVGEACVAFSVGEVCAFGWEVGVQHVGWGVACCRDTLVGRAHARVKTCFSRR